MVSFLLMNDYAIQEWRKLASMKKQLDLSNVIIDCSASSSRRTPDQNLVHIVCPPAPKKPKLDFIFDFRRSKEDVGCQTDLSLGKMQMKGLMMHFVRIYYGCRICRTLVIGDSLKVPDCSFCDRPMTRSVGTNVGLYHMVPYFQ
jgi:hypothetical protein